MVADPSASRNEQVAPPCAEGASSAPPDVRALVKALGGATAVAQACGVTLQAVSMWSGLNSIPHRHHAIVWRLAQARGVPWTPPGFEGVRLQPVDTCHADDPSVTSSQSVCEFPVKDEAA